MSSSEEGPTKALAQEMRTCLQGPSGTPTPYWRVTGPSGTLHLLEGHRPIRNPMPLEGSHAHPELSSLTGGSQALACKTSWDHFPMILGLRE